MAEVVVVRQNSRFEIAFLASNENEDPSAPLEPVEHIHELTPYGMMLAGLASCTTIVLHTYAQNHDIPLEEVEIRVAYERIFQEDCVNCEQIEQYDEQILEQISFSGDLTPDQRKRLERVAHFCPIYKMYMDGVDIKTSMTASTT
jgi:putative redox protein